MTSRRPGRPGRAARALLPLPLLLCQGAPWAGVPEQRGTEIEIGTGAMDVAVLSGDRVVAVALSTSPPSVAWIDTADFSGGPWVVDLDADSAVAVAAAVLDDEPALLVGGSQLDVLRWSDSEPVPLPSPSADSPIGLGTSGGEIAALVWDAARTAAYAADSERLALRHFALDGSGDPADSISDAWPVELGWEPRDLVLIDADRLLVVGADGDEGRTALVDLAYPAAPAILLENQLAGALPAALASDGAGTAWLLQEDGSVQRWTFGGGGGDDDDDSTGADDDDSAVADDDDSTVADDDDSAPAGDDDDSAAARGSLDWDIEVLVDGGVSPALDVIFRDEGAAGGRLYVLAENLVTVYDESGLTERSIAISSRGAALAAASSDDGHLFAAEPENGQLAVLAPGPWIELESVDPTAISGDSDAIELSFVATLADDGDSCDWEVLAGGGITGDGEAIEGVSGTAESGESVAVTLSGEQLPAGSGRVFVFCADVDGDRGRASFAYYKGDLSAPSGFSVQAGSGHVVVSWDGLSGAEVDVYRLWFDDASFGSSEEPDACNGDSQICSPYELDSEQTVSSGDDDSADDDDDTTVIDVESFEVDVDELENGTTYYFAVAAVDRDGSEGPRTEVLAATPSVTGGAAALAGDEGGCGCANAGARGGAPSGQLALALAALLALPVFRRSAPVSKPLKSLTISR
jgi:hypothetical protein